MIYLESFLNYLTTLNYLNYLELADHPELQVYLNYLTYLELPELLELLELPELSDLPELQVYLCQAEKSTPWSIKRIEDESFTSAVKQIEYKIFKKLKYFICSLTIYLKNSSQSLCESGAEAYTGIGPGGEHDQGPGRIHELVQGRGKNP